MKKTLLIFVWILALGASAIGFAGCKSDDKIDSSVISNGTQVSQTMQEENQDLDKKSYAGLEDVFKDTKLITPEGKYMMMVFGANGCTYCEKLKEDIKNVVQMRQYIKDNFSAYYINMSYSKMHDFKVGTPNDPKEIRFSTSQLAQIYNIRPTPTIVFASTDGKTILEFPGYIPAPQFNAMLKFIGEGEWKKAKDQKELRVLLQEYILKNSTSRG